MTATIRWTAVTFAPAIAAVGLAGCGGHHEVAADGVVEQTALASSSVGVQFVFSAINVNGATTSDANGSSTQAIAGDFTTADGSTHGFILKNTSLVQLDFGGEGFTTANGINEQGQIAGIFLGDTSGQTDIEGKTDTDDRLFGYFLDKVGDMPVKLSPPQGPSFPTGSSVSTALGINGLAQVVGTYRETCPNPPCNRHGYLWSGDDNYTQVHVPGDSEPLGTVPLAIDDSGDIVGTFFDASQNLNGFRWNNFPSGTPSPINIPGAQGTAVEGINNAGQMVGFYCDNVPAGCACNGAKKPCVEHGFLLSSNVLTSIDFASQSTSNVSSTAVFGINAQGVIVGSYWLGNSGNPKHFGPFAFVGTPVLP
jgi:hypothetical protein